MNYNVLDFSAIGDGMNDDGKAIQNAIDKCAEQGGGRVILPSGYTFYSHSLELKTNVDLHIEKGSVLKAHSDYASYLRPNQGHKDQGINCQGTPVTLKPSYAFIYALNADNISISGNGIIDGNCYAFVDRVDRYYCNSKIYPRPTMIYVEHCNHISFYGITLRNSPFWTLHPAGCDDVLITNIRILNPLDVANSDGIDPDHSTNVRIIGCHITCADDAICLKSSAGNNEYGLTENILIADCTLVSTSAAIKIGTEGVGNFRNILVENCIISRSNRGISIQIRDGGCVENVIFSNILIETRYFSEHFWGCAEPIAITSINRDHGIESGKISNITFKDIRATGENGCYIYTDTLGKIFDIKFDDVEINLIDKTKWEKGFHDQRPGLNTKVVKEHTHPFSFTRVRDLVLSNCSFKVIDKRDFFISSIKNQDCLNLKIKGN